MGLPRFCLWCPQPSLANFNHEVDLRYYLFPLLHSASTYFLFVFPEAFPKMASHQPEEPAVVRSIFSLVDELKPSWGGGRSEGRGGFRCLWARTAVGYSHSQPRGMIGGLSVTFSQTRIRLRLHGGTFTCLRRMLSHLSHLGFWSSTLPTGYSHKSCSSMDHCCPFPTFAWNVDQKHARRRNGTV